MQYSDIELDFLWEKYCKAVKNNELVRRNSHIDNDKIVH